MQPTNSSASSSSPTTSQNQRAARRSSTVSLPLASLSPSPSSSSCNKSSKTGGRRTSLIHFKGLNNESKTIPTKSSSVLNMENNIFSSSSFTTPSSSSNLLNNILNNSSSVTEVATTAAAKTTKHEEIKSLHHENQEFKRLQKESQQQRQEQQLFGSQHRKSIYENMKESEKFLQQQQQQQQQFSPGDNTNNLTNSLIKISYSPSPMRQVARGTATALPPIRVEFGGPLHCEVDLRTLDHFMLGDDNDEKKKDNKSTISSSSSSSPPSNKKTFLTSKTPTPSKSSTPSGNVNNNISMLSTATTTATATSKTPTPKKIKFFEDNYDEAWEERRQLISQRIYDLTPNAPIFKRLFRDEDARLRRQNESEVKESRRRDKILVDRIPAPKHQPPIPAEVLEELSTQEVLELEKEQMNRHGIDSSPIGREEEQEKLEARRKSRKQSMMLHFQKSFREIPRHAHHHHHHDLDDDENNNRRRTSHVILTEAPEEENQHEHQHIHKRLVIAKKHHHQHHHENDKKEDQEEENITPPPEIKMNMQTSFVFPIDNNNQAKEEDKEEEEEEQQQQGSLQHHPHRDEIEMLSSQATSDEDFTDDEEEEEYFSDDEDEESNSNNSDTSSHNPDHQDEYHEFDPQEIEDDELGGGTPVVNRKLPATYTASVKNLLNQIRLARPESQQRGLARVMQQRGGLKIKSSQTKRKMEEEERRLLSDDTTTNNNAGGGDNENSIHGRRGGGGVLRTKNWLSQRTLLEEALEDLNKISEDSYMDEVTDKALFFRHALASEGRGARLRRAASASGKHSSGSSQFAPGEDSFSLFGSQYFNADDLKPTIMNSYDIRRQRKREPFGGGAAPTGVGKTLISNYNQRKHLRRKGELAPFLKAAHCVDGLKQKGHIGVGSSVTLGGKRFVYDETMRG